MKYRKKPIVIEAKQFDGTYAAANYFWMWISMYSNQFTDPVDIVCIGDNEHKLTIKTLEGDMAVKKGDWVIKGVKNEFYPCKPDIFEATYEPVEEECEG